MKIRMKVSISGTRDGEAWPEKGGVTDLPEGEAKHLVAIGLATEPTEDEPLDEVEAVDEENAKAPADEETATPAGRKPAAPRKAPTSK